MSDNIVTKHGDGSISWMPKSEYKARKKLAAYLKKMSEDILWGVYKPPEPKEDDNVKLAIVEIGGKREMIGVDNQSMKGYAMEPPGYTWKLPLEPLQYDRFIRWATLMDV